MKQRARYLMGIAVVLLTLCAATSSQAQTGGYDLSWFSVDSSGYAMSAGGGYELGGMAGQSDAGALSGGGYTLSGGFWGDGTLGGPYRVYLPIALR
jgi:hypothetical protein